MSVLAELARASGAYQQPEVGSTRAALIAAAEKLFAKHGIEGVSLRAICAAAGQGNTRALQYHFSDRGGIVREIMLSRFKVVEARRAQLLKTALADDAKLEISQLLEILMRPISEMAGGEERNDFARFLYQVLVQTHHWTPFLSEGPKSVELTATEIAYGQMVERLLFLDETKVFERIGSVLRMFLGALIDRENTLFDGGVAPSLERTMAEQFGMGAAAISAPLLGSEQQRSRRPAVVAGRQKRRG